MLKRSKSEAPVSRARGQVPLEYAEAYAFQAIEFCRNGEAERAIAALGKALSLDPENERTLAMRGALWLSLGHPRKAIGDLSKAVILNPRNADAYSHRAQAYQSLGCLGAAVVDYAKALRLEVSRRDDLIRAALQYRFGGGAPAASED